jgi:hypothetical protein
VLQSPTRKIKPQRKFKIGINYKGCRRVKKSSGEETQRSARAEAATVSRGGRTKGKRMI